MSRDITYCHDWGTTGGLLERSLGFIVEYVHILQCLSLPDNKAYLSLNITDTTIEKPYSPTGEKQIL